MLGELTLDGLMSQVRVPLCLTDPKAPDNPIVYVNKAFLDLTGYAPDEVLGRNCRFLQGPGTTEESLQEVRAAVRDQKQAVVEIVNYRKNGERFINALQLGPIQNAAGETVLLFGSQLDITVKREAERLAALLDVEEQIHRLRNIVNVMSGVIRMTAREAEDVASFSKQLSERLHVLGEAHFNTFRSNDQSTDSMSNVLRTILTAYAPLGASQFTIAGDDFRVGRAQITPLTLTLHELATNSVKHGALGAETGHVTVAAQAMNQGTSLRLHWQEEGGPKVAVPTRAGGSRIIRSLLAAIGGDLTLDWREGGLQAEITMSL